MSHLPRTGKRAPKGAKSKTIAGSSTEGAVYQNAEELWKQVGEEDLYSDKGWYGKSLQYWEKIPPTVNGVLGGMEHVHDSDIKESEAFIRSLPSRGEGRALDCGAGIGRITRHLLLRLYSVVDLLEPVGKMLDQAKLELSAPDSSGHQVGHFYQTSMEKHTPEEKYDLVVIQWAAIYLTDDDFVKVFKQYKESLTENGYIFFKENCSSQESFLVDCDDSSLTRSDKHYKQLFERAGVRVVKEAFQKDWPNNLMKVKMYGLK